MFERSRTFLARHPAVRDALLWAIPALILGAVLRALLLSYLPYAHWGSDSRSYYKFAHQLLLEGEISLGAKRRFLYPFLMVPLSLLPGEPLRNLAWLQHALGLATIIPLAYVVRKSFVHWRLWIVPITALFTSMPVFLWYEHELLGEAVFFCALVWTFAGWSAWVQAEERGRAPRLFWWFLVPLAAFLLTKPSGRFVVPGLVLGMVLVTAWRRMTVKNAVAFGAVLLSSLAVGAKEQGAWLFYVAAFPLTQLDTPAHAEYKAQIRDLVEPLREKIDAYHTLDDEPFAFLEAPRRQPDRTLWAAIDDKPAEQSRLYLDLALEAVRAEPLLFLYLGLQRAVISANPSGFKEQRFTSETHRNRFEDDFKRGIEEEARGHYTYMHRIFGFAKGERLPSWEEFRDRVVPHRAPWMERTLVAFVTGYERTFDLTRLPQASKKEQSFRRLTILPLGWWLLAALPFAFLPAYRRTLGVWLLVALSYLGGVFLVSQMNPRYFAPAWPLLLPLFFIPLDVLVRLISARFRRSAA
jgi:hypothetical protein